MKTRNLHVVLGVGSRGLSGPILYRMEHRRRRGRNVTGKHYTSDEVHGILSRVPCFEVVFR